MKSKVLNLILLLSFFRTISGETYAYFDHFTTKDGLISNRVTAIAQDSLGYIWMATDFGLERFDGKKFKHFQRKDYPKLFRNDFHGVDYYRDKVIISGNNGMLMEYDIERDDFFDIKPQDFEDNYYKQTGRIYRKNDEEYLMTSSGIYLYDKNKKEYTTQFAAYDSIQETVQGMYIDDYDRIWIGSTYKNVTVYDSTIIGEYFGWNGENVIIVFKLNNIAQKILAVTPPAL